MPFPNLQSEMLEPMTYFLSVDFESLTINLQLDNCPLGKMLLCFEWHLWIRNSGGQVVSHGRKCLLEVENPVNQKGENEGLWNMNWLTSVGFFCLWKQWFILLYRCVYNEDWKTLAVIIQYSWSGWCFSSSVNILTVPAGKTHLKANTATAQKSMAFFPLV